MAKVDDAKARARKSGTGSITKTNKVVKRAKKPRLSGVEQLRQAADWRVERSVKKLADLLEKDALAGKLDSTRMLVALAEKKKAAPEAVKPRVSLASIWRAEPQWKGPMEGEEEQGLGTRE